MKGAQRVGSISLALQNHLDPLEELLGTLRAIARLRVSLTVSTASRIRMGRS